MARNYDNYGYEYDNNRPGLVRIIIIIVLVLAAIILTLLLMNSCSRRSGNNENNGGNGGGNSGDNINREQILLNAGKNYYQAHMEEVPNAIGECSLVDLQTLQDARLVSSNDFPNCNLSTTFLKVCMLENKQLAYTPWITCNGKYSDTEYGNLVEGTLSDLIVNQTYIEFKFLPQVMKKGGQTLGPVEEMWKDEITYDSYKTLATTKYYRYRDKLFTWNLSKRNYYTSTGDVSASKYTKEYYPLSPRVGYTGYSDRTFDAYKWYTVTGGVKEYYMQGNAPGYSATAVGDYTIKETPAIEVIGYSKRSVISTYSPKKYYGCTTGANGTREVLTPYPCGSSGHNPGYNYTLEVFYTCVDSTSTKDAIRANMVSGPNSTCYKYGAWSDYSRTDTCNIKDTTVCRYKVAYLYKWYKVTGEKKAYYPSGSTTASGEKVYYTSAPVKGAIKDTSTKTTAYKWYSETKSVSTKFTAVAPSGYSSATRTEDYKWTEWSSWSKKNPKVNDGRIRSIETKSKIKLQKINPASGNGWENLSDNYMYEDELINLFKTKNYDVNNLEDINNNGEIKYLLKMYIRNKKGDK